MELEEKPEVAPVELPEVIEVPEVDSLEESAQTESQAETGTESGELEVTIDDGSPPSTSAEKESVPFREVRNAHREAEKARKAAERRTKELEAELDALRNPKPQSMPEPSLEDPDVDFDEAKFRAKTKAWLQATLKQEEEARKAEELKQQETKRIQAEYETHLAEYNRQIGELKVANFQEYQDAVADSLSIIQQNWILEYAERKAAVVAALGSHPQELEKLKAITREGRFVKALEELESKVKTSPRKPPPPETAIASTRGVSGQTREQQLRAKAMETGNFDELHRYQRAQRQN